MSNWVYHKELAPKIVSDEEYADYLKAGWADSPAKVNEAADHAELTKLNTQIAEGEKELAELRADTKNAEQPKGEKTNKEPKAK